MHDTEFQESPYRHILFCTDFSENADFAFDYAIDAVRRRPGAVLHLLHVIPESDAQFWKTYIYEVDDIDEKAKKDIDEKIHSSYLSRVPSGVEVRVSIQVGKDSLKILEFAQSHQIDLIVIGRQGRSRWQKPWFGNVTEKVARKAGCAVLIIPYAFEKKIENEPPSKE